MNDARCEEIRRVVTLIKEIKDILEGGLDQEQDGFDKMPEEVQNDRRRRRSYGEGVPRPSLARLMTRRGARRIAEGFAKLADLVQCLSKAAH